MENTEMPSDVAVVARMLTDGFAKGDASIVDQLCSPDVVEHQFGLAGRGAEAIEKTKQAIRQVHEAMPDLRLEPADWSQHGDTVWVRAEGIGTNTGPFLGPQTGREVHFTVMDVARIRDGRIVEHWGVPDRFALLLQMGRLDSLLAANAADG